MGRALEPEGPGRERPPGCSGQQARRGVSPAKLGSLRLLDTVEGVEARSQPRPFPCVLHSIRTVDCGPTPCGAPH